MRALIIALGVAVAASAHAVPSQDLERARQAFRTGQFALALPLYNALLYPEPQLASRDDLASAYVSLGVCRFIAGDIEGAKREFREALRQDPNQQIDATIVTNHGAIELFDRTKIEIATAADRERQRIHDAEELERQRQIIANSKIVTAHQFGLNLVPFGAGQFQNHDYLKGALIAGGEVATAATSAAIWGVLVNRYGLTNNHVPFPDGPHVRLLQQVEIGTGLGFFAIYGYGIIDAILHYKSETTRQANESDFPELAKPKPTAPKKTSFHIVPMLAPNSAGIGLAWEN